MQWASSMTSSPQRSARAGSWCSRKLGLLRRSGLTNKRSTESVRSASRTSSHSVALAEFMVTARIPARSAATIWSRINANRGDTISVGPAPPARRSIVVTK